jgi:signal peptidase I
MLDERPQTPPETPGDDGPGGVRATWRRLRANPIVDLLVTLAFAAVIAYVVQLWVVKPYHVPSGSMENTLHVGDRIIAARFIYHLTDPARGEILVFHPNGFGDAAAVSPTNHVSSETFVKRLIGLPNEWISASKGHVDVCKTGPHSDCTVLNESYVSSPQEDFPPVHIPPNHYFMMGDNRSDSDDSRTWGPIDRSQIIGRVFMTYWPPDRISFY